MNETVTGRTAGGVMGHSPLDAQTVGQINETKQQFKELIEHVDNLLEGIWAGSEYATMPELEKIAAADHWLEQARSYLQTGSMCAVRALAAPDSLV